MMIKNLTPRLAERGKIKIGVKGEMRRSSRGTDFQPPQKLDHFVITTLDRDASGNFMRDAAIHALIGDAPRRIPVRLLFNDVEMNFMSRYACFSGRKMWCAGDGETARRVVDAGGHETVVCPCERIDQAYTGQDRCKPNGALSVVIDGTEGVGNVWTFRTTSWNSIQNITSSLYQIKALSGGVLAGLPIDMVLAPKEVTAPDGKMMKAWVVSLQFSGTVEDLRAVGYKLLSSEKTHDYRMKTIEDEVKRLMYAPPLDTAPLHGDDATDIEEEFYPDQVLAHQSPPRPSAVDYQQPAQTPADAPYYRVADQWGEIIYEGYGRQIALATLRKAALDQDNAALSDLNPSLWPDIAGDGAPAAVADAPSPASLHPAGDTMPPMPEFGLPETPALDLDFLRRRVDEFWKIPDKKLGKEKYQVWKNSLSNDAKDFVANYRNSLIKAEAE